MGLKIKRKAMWITLIIITVTLFALSFTKFEIRKEITINAHPKEVWSVITDFQTYNKWNTQLQYLDGEVKHKGKLHLRLSVSGAEPYEFKPIISTWEVNKKFAWKAKTGLPRIFDGEHFFELKKLEEDKTLVINREEYRGVFSLIMKNMPMMKEAPKGFEQMNLELKNYIENEGKEFERKI